MSICITGRAKRSVRDVVAVGHGAHDGNDVGRADEDLVAPDEGSGLIGEAVYEGKGYAGALQYRD